MAMRSTPWEQRFRAVWRREQRFLEQYREPAERLLDQKAAEIAPEKLMETLSAAFEKAVSLVLERGSGVILRGKSQSRRRETYQINAYAADLRETRKNLRAFSRAAERGGVGSQLLSGAAGIGMGALGVALPDIPLLTAMLLKCVYETAESFGFSCEEELEKLYALRVLEASLSQGEALLERNRVLETFAQTGVWPEAVSMREQIRATARQLSEAALWSKALQSVPVVGVVGGARNWSCLGRVRRYAAIKYEKRFLLRRRLERR